MKVLIKEDIEDNTIDDGTQYIRPLFDVGCGLNQTQKHGCWWPRSKSMFILSFKKFNFVILFYSNLELFFLELKWNLSKRRLLFWSWSEMVTSAMIFRWERSISRMVSVVFGMHEGRQWWKWNKPESLVFIHSAEKKTNTNCSVWPFSLLFTTRSLSF